MSKKPVAAALLVFAALLLLLLSAEQGAAFHVGRPSGHRSGSSSSSISRRQQQARQRLAVAEAVEPATAARGFCLSPLRSTTEDKAVEPAASASVSPADAASTQATEAPAGPCEKFPKCSGAMRGKGCDGMGKIQGGIATVPGLGWWPIKVRKKGSSTVVID